MATTDETSEQILTPEGKKKLEERLQELINVERPKNKEELALARSQGDLSENADYDAARNKQAEIEGEILDIQHKLDTYKVVGKQAGISGVQLGSVVTIQNLKKNETFTYKVVGSSEVNLTLPIPQVASNSPLIKAIFGHGKGDVVVIPVAKPYKVKIIEVK